MSGMQYGKRGAEVLWSPDTGAGMGGGAGFDCSPSVPISEALFAAIVERGETMARNTGTESTPRFSADHTLINLARAGKPVRGSVVLTWEAGGSHTGAAAWICDRGGKLSKVGLFDLKYDRLRAEAGGRSCEQIARMTAEKSAEALAALGKEGAEVSAIGMVWSNAILAEPRLGQSRGVTGIVTGVRKGISYRKPEDKAAQGCQDGDDIGAMYLEAAAAVDIFPRAFGIGNDTGLTGKAAGCPVHAGAVMSTGANATIIPSGSDSVCSSEAGNMVLTDLFPADSPALRGRETLKLEDLCARGWIGSALTARVMLLAEEDRPRLRGLARAFAENPGLNFTAADLDALVADGGRGLSDVRARHPELGELLSDDIFLDLTIAAELTARQGGALAGAMLYFSVYNQAPQLEGRTAVFAVDSRLARTVSAYNEAMHVSLARLLAPRRITPQVLLLAPEEVESADGMSSMRISVPMAGAAHLAWDLLDLFPGGSSKK